MTIPDYVPQRPPPLMTVTIRPRHCDHCTTELSIGGLWFGATKASGLYCSPACVEAADAAHPFCPPWWRRLIHRT